MKTFIPLLALFFAAGIAAQEVRQVSSGTTSIPFRGQSITFEHTRYSDGTDTKTYRDSEGNPLPELERNYFEGWLKQSAMISRSEASYRFTAESEDVPLHLIAAFGENPGFRAFTGITLEQMHDIILEQWDRLPENNPTDEMLDIFVRAGRTEDAAELDAIGMELWAVQMAEREELNETMTAILSPEQRQKLVQLQWVRQTMQDDFGRRAEAENENVTYGRPLRLGIYKTLDLSAEQQRRMESLKAEYFQALSEHFEKIRAGNAAEDGVARLRRINEITETIQPRVEAMLTDAQRARLEQLLANKPEFLMPRAPSPPREKEEQWMPGPESWRPGDPLPPGRIPPLPPRRFPSLAL